MTVDCKRVEVGGSTIQLLNQSLQFNCLQSCSVSDVVCFSNPCSGSSLLRSLQSFSERSSFQSLLSVTCASTKYQSLSSKSTNSSSMGAESFILGCFTPCFKQVALMATPLLWSSLFHLLQDSSFFLLAKIIFTAIESQCHHV